MWPDRALLFHLSVALYQQNKILGKPQGDNSTTNQQAQYYQPIPARAASRAPADAGQEQFILVPSTSDQKDAPDEKAVQQTALASRVGSARVSSMMKGMGAAKVLKTRMVDTFGLASSGSGSCYVAAPILTLLKGTGEFTEFIGVFDEYKVRSVKATFIPFTPNKVEASINPNGRSLVWAFDPNDSAVPTSAASLFANSTAHVFSNQKVAVSTWRVDSSNPAVWYSTLSTTNPLEPAMSIKIAGDPNLGTSVSFGAVWLEYEVLFRFRR